jgi:hypothetical protein
MCLPNVTNKRRMGVFAVVPVFKGVNGRSLNNEKAEVGRVTAENVTDGRRQSFSYFFRHVRILRIDRQVSVNTRFSSGLMRFTIHFRRYGLTKKKRKKKNYSVGFGQKIRRRVKAHSWQKNCS